MNIPIGKSIGLIARGPGFESHGVCWMDFSPTCTHSGAMWCPLIGPCSALRLGHITMIGPPHRLLRHLAHRLLTVCHVISMWGPPTMSSY